MEEKFVASRSEDLKQYMAQILQVPSLLDVEPFTIFITENLDVPHYSSKLGFYKRGIETPSPSPMPSPVGHKRALDVSGQDPEKQEEEKKAVTEAEDSIFGDIAGSISQASDGIVDSISQASDALEDMLSGSGTGDDSAGGGSTGDSAGGGSTPSKGNEGEGDMSEVLSRRISQASDDIADVLEDVKRRLSGHSSGSGEDSGGGDVASSGDAGGDAVNGDVDPVEGKVTYPTEVEGA
jgi:hypothetical protein